METDSPELSKRAETTSLLEKLGEVWRTPPRDYLPTFRAEDLPGQVSLPPAPLPQPLPPPVADDAVDMVRSIRRPPDQPAISGNAAFDLRQSLHLAFDSPPAHQPVVLPRVEAPVYQPAPLPPAQAPAYQSEPLPQVVTPVSTDLQLPRVEKMPSPEREALPGINLPPVKRQELPPLLLPQARPQVLQVAAPDEKETRPLAEKPAAPETAGPAALPSLPPLLPPLSSHQWLPPAVTTEKVETPFSMPLPNLEAEEPAGLKPPTLAPAQAPLQSAGSLQPSGGHEELLSAVRELTHAVRKMGQGKRETPQTTLRRAPRIGQGGEE